MIRESRDGKIVLAYIEGDQTTLQLALQQFGAVVSRRLTSQLKPSIASGNPTALPSHNEDNGADKHAEEAEIETLEDRTAVEESATRPKKKFVPKTPDLLTDFDPDSGSIPFLDFAKQKNPSTTIDKYLVVGGWFKDHRSVDEITTSHIFTCFKLAEWLPPDDMASTFRDIKRKNHYFEKGSKNGHWKINILGLKELTKMNSATTD
jgi:hypothetical protein